MRKQPSPAVRQRLIDLGLVSFHYQPEAHFINNGRRLRRVAEPGDPWMATIMRQGPEREFIGTALAATLDEAISQALASPRGRIAMGGLHGKLAKLEVEIDVLCAAMRGDVPF